MIPRGSPVLLPGDVDLEADLRPHQRRVDHPAPVAALPLPASPGGPPLPHQGEAELQLRLPAGPAPRPHLPPPPDLLPQAPGRGPLQAEQGRAGCRVCPVSGHLTASHRLLPGHHAPGHRGRGEGGHVGHAQASLQSQPPGPGRHRQLPQPRHLLSQVQ